MSILLLLIPISLLFVVTGAVAFFWAVNHDQFDDLDTPALLPLVDSDPAPQPGTVPAAGAVPLLDTAPAMDNVPAMGSVPAAGDA
ncbi:MAG: cbb3-type cytochrome oxidase assembly protein CcoS [Lautropia sp.]